MSSAFSELKSLDGLFFNQNTCTLFKTLGVRRCLFCSMILLLRYCFSKLSSFSANVFTVQAPFDRTRGCESSFCRVSFYKSAVLENGLEYRSGDWVVLASNPAVLSSRADTSPESWLRSPCGISLTKVVRCFVQEGDLPIYALVEDVFGRTELAARAIRCEPHFFDQFFPSTNISAVPIARLASAYVKCPNQFLSSSCFVDIDRREVVPGICPSVERLQQSALSNHNISFYHAVHKRCTAHVIGEIMPDNGVDGALVLLRYFYRYDEEDIVAADAAQKQVQTALKGRTYFKKVPRLWSNHFALARVKNPRLEDAILFCDPADYTHLEVCCFLRYELPQKKILALPSYLKLLPGTVPELDLSVLLGSAEGLQSSSMAKIAAIDEHEAPPSDRRKKRRQSEEASYSASSSPRDLDLAAYHVPKKIKWRTGNSSDEISDESSSSALYESPRSFPSPLSSHRNSIDMGQHQYLTQQHPLMMMQQSTNPFFSSFFQSAPFSPYSMFGHSTSGAWATQPQQTLSLLPHVPISPQFVCVAPTASRSAPRFGLDSLIEAMMFESADSAEHLVESRVAVQSQRA